MNPETWSALAILLFLIQDRVPWKKCPLCRKRTSPRDMIKVNKKRACDSCIIEGRKP